MTRSLSSWLAAEQFRAAIAELGQRRDPNQLHGPFQLGGEQLQSPGHTPLTARSHAEVTGFFAGLDLIDPGVVQLHRWRAGTGNPGTIRNLPNYGALARKPA